jgi:glycine hydroxymethyltransferase
MIMNYLPQTDPQVEAIIKGEEKRQAETLMMIPSENYASKAVEQAVGSSFGNKYSEGYPHARYYQGQEFADQLEDLTIERAKKLFDVPFVNVQPYSGSPANAAVYFALLQPGDTIMGLKLSHGGHLTHGHPKVTFSGKFFNSVQYEVEADGTIDYEKVAKQVKQVKPKLIIAGTTAYPRTLHFDTFAAMAENVGAYLMADVSHIAGLIVGGVHPSPVPHAHVVTTTTHKTLRGPRGAMIMVTQKGLSKNALLGKKINAAILPGLQGGPHLNTIAGLAVALKEAATPQFRSYAKHIVKNARVLAETLEQGGLEVVTGGTDNHLMVVDVRPLKLLGRDAAVMLEQAHIVCNSNTVPFDPNPPANPSGIRLGTPACTTRGMKEKEMKLIGKLIVDTLKGAKSTQAVAKEIKQLCKQFPIPKAY